MFKQLDIKYILKKYGITLTLFTFLFIILVKRFDYLENKYGLIGIGGLMIGLVTLSLFLELVMKKENKKEKTELYMKDTVKTLLDTLLDEFKESQKQIAELLNDLFDTVGLLSDTLAVIKDRLFQFDKDITKEIEHIYLKLEGNISIEVYKFILQEYAFVIAFRLIEIFVLKVYLVLGQKIDKNLLQTLMKTYYADVRYILQDSENDLRIRYFTNNQSAFTELRISERFKTLQEYILSNLSIEKLQDLTNKQYLLTTVINTLKFATQKFGEIKK